MERTILQATAGSGAFGLSNEFKTRDRADFSPATQTSTPAPGKVQGKILVPSGVTLPAGTTVAVYGNNSLNPIGQVAVSGLAYALSVPPGRYAIKFNLPDATVQAKKNVDVKSGQVSTINFDYTDCKPVVLLLPGILGSTLISSPETWVVPRLGSGDLTNADQLKVFNPTVLSKPDYVGFAALRAALSTDFDVRDVPYDWRLKPERVAGEFLKPMIDIAKKAQSGCTVTKVNVVAHSMGGIVARMYVQGKAINSSNFAAAVPYENDIDRLLMLGTPNSGSALPYWMIEGGDPETADHVSHIKEGLVDSLIDLYQDATEAAMLDMNQKSNQAEAVKKFFSERIPSIRYLMAGHVLSQDDAPIFTLPLIDPLRWTPLSRQLSS